jgi:hypothetical protein
MDVTQIRHVKQHCITAIKKFNIAINNTTEEKLWRCVEWYYQSQERDIPETVKKMDRGELRKLCRNICMDAIDKDFYNYITGEPAKMCEELYKVLGI